MTNNQLTDERLVKILSETQATIMEHNSRCVRGSVEVDARLFESMIMELQERRKADSEPVAYIDNEELERLSDSDSGVVRTPNFGPGYQSATIPLYRHAQQPVVSDSEPVYQCEFCHSDTSGELQWHWEDVNKAFYEQYDSEHRGQRRILYFAPQPSPERERVRLEHAEWSQATFGNVGPVGPLKHLSKEALEAAAEPDDLSEWADMQFLMWDAQRRAGITDEQITQAMIEKLAVNKSRSWPEPKDGEPRLHIKEQPAPVVPDELLSMVASAIEDLLEHTDPNTSYYSGVWADVPVKLRAAMLQAGNSPVIPDGYVMVPKEPTEAMMLHNSGCQHHTWDDPDCAMRQTRRLIWSHMLAAAPQEVNHG